MNVKLRPLKVMIATLVFSVGAVGVAFATGHSATTEFAQTINAGTLTASILDDSQQTVANPGVTMSAITASTVCQTPGSTGTLGTNTERLYVDNPEAANSGWVLSIAATAGASAEWSDGTNTMSHADGDNGGCDNGQMSLDPTAGTITTDCASCTLTGLSEGSAAAFTSPGGALELMNASGSADTIWRGYLTGVDVEQVIPAEQPVGNYLLDMTVTVVAS